MTDAQAQMLVIIPARMASTRLPGKPLADIGGVPMVVRVARQALLADIGRVAVATDSTEIAKAVQAAGIEAVMTRDDHESGSDRVFEAARKMDPDGRAQIILNVQGDIPAIEPETIRRSALPLLGSPADLATLAVEIAEEAEKTNPSIVKVVGTPIGPGMLRALYFTRATAPYGAGPLYHHIGLYAWRRPALERFVSLRPSTLERRESLEQLRALENGMRIDVAIVDSVPLGVDTPADLERARQILAPT
ncbi:MAG: 3-deoxy-manno-octulosonate cytidylyltransferase [Hoeflea sp.]|uniref:3-deoxy-manno-octulosonate cytidylyltransferase n=1 Tax=Hoeflea sp. TaxID=1940281 RepID=UPI001D84627F|nr:3-deoxy-manno-octulosonate cytidylyltransferase [Hoeflea sp.]MBU4531623.1 3-deoxy-manno-octulosonate cytidylyltransferase [Alphaproteobacteria bacterium]MBU4544480.1 3-deoxy-manno-octulosonate cytidylyltransferase [Alphaproteobacteria bacterium]MBU4552711.1 3-deoxy-manno-octulosonate cytidylyltransferase [Alphaproteobacteria bacterium]MBV1724899.1 3-deoxy-manno-octulosonate cytidylyltransferase [Hoeflea sp.]MBV1760919.1 3-deoxy-manno-octulosonate cytidylyltransferase [Hoeflea sp.]